MINRRREGTGFHLKSVMKPFHPQTHSLLSLLTDLAPGDVSPDEQRPPEAAEDPQQDEGGQLHQVPRGVELHVEQHQPAVSERVDGAQGEGRDQGGEEGAPQGLQGEVITHLKEGKEEKESVRKEKLWVCE